MPALTERPEDVVPLAEMFLLRFAGPNYKLDNNAKKVLERKSYPYNVRSLEQTVRSAIAIAKERGIFIITRNMILENDFSDADYQYYNMKKATEKLEYELSQKALLRTSNAYELAAKLMAISVPTLRRIIGRR